ncbi:MAG: hypothetical protein E7623_01770 [Ruminococcaceae bacterium]|nr:hypothetical protein [Oscillospiraceae bacterium]
MKRFLVIILLIFSAFLFLSSASASTSPIFTDDGVSFGPYYYYISDGDIYRASLTEMAGETELFRKDSTGIALDESTLISKHKDGKLSFYSLISDANNYQTDNYRSDANVEDSLLGSLSKKYESNGNPAAISSGNGDAGGASFGAYQFASNAGVPFAFSNWCISSGNAKNIGERLLTAYEADHSSCGDNFKAEWRAIAAEDADFFLSLQHTYVKEKYYDAIVARVEKNVANFDIDMYGIALKNVFWSRSVQHGVGGSYNVITTAFSNLGGFDMQSEEILIRAIYAESGALSDTGHNVMTGSTAESYGIAGKYMKYYSRNSSSVQVSVYRRLNINELTDALNMLSKYGGYVPSDDTPYEFGGLRASDVTDASAMLFGTIYNYRLANVTEYGFYIGKNGKNLIEIPVSTDLVSKPVITLSMSTLNYSPELDPLSTYHFGIYAIIDGEFVISESSLFVTDYATVYTAYFLNYDGAILKSITLREGRTPSYSGNIPQKPEDKQFKYTFVGWDKEITPLTEDAFYTAVYSETLQRYSVKYFSESGDLLFENEISYGENSVYNGVLPPKGSNKQFRYEFLKWNESEENVTQDMEFFPVYRKVDLIWTGLVSDSFSGGDGSKASPYSISNAEELAYLSKYINAGEESKGKYFRLNNNIVLGTSGRAEIFTPIGTEENPFSGHFDGAGYKIYGLHVQNDSEAALFGVTMGASFENIIIEKAEINGDTSGILIGKVLKDASSIPYIKNCRLSGNVSGTTFAGGAFGSVNDVSVSVSNIRTSGKVNGKTSGGICGYFGGLSLSESFSDTNVSGEFVGGVCGQKNAFSSVSSCYYRENGLSDSKGKPIEDENLSDQLSYSGFDFDETWVISNETAELNIFACNTFTYYVYGDINGNGFLDSPDAVLLAQHLANWNINLPSDFHKKADVNNDNTIDSIDAVRFAQYLAGWKVSLGWNL